MADTFTNILSTLSGGTPVDVLQEYLDTLLVGFSSVSSTPANTIEFSFNTPAVGDCMIIAFYSTTTAGLWKPLAFTDTTDGLKQRGKLHFEPPPDWGATRAWTDTVDINGGAPGTGPLAYWIKIQRRAQPDSISGAKLSALAATNRPYLTMDRVGQSIKKVCSSADYGKTIAFRFVPVDWQDVAHDSDPNAITTYQMPVPTPAFSLTVDPSFGGATVTSGSTYNFSDVTVGSNEQIIFEITNNGQFPLLLTNNPKIVISGTNANQFQLILTAPTPVAANGGTSHFTLRFAPTSTGAKNAVITIPNDDPLRSSFSFNVHGVGV